MRSSSSDSDRTYDSSCRENSSDSRRLSSSATRRRSRSLCTSRRYHLYHEPNFIAMPSDLPTVATLHDLSVLLRPEWHPLDRVKHFERNFARSLNRCTHFFAISAQLMRHILVEFARRHGSLKRGGEVQRVSLEESLVVYGERGADLVVLDDALQALAAIDARRSRVVELRFFGGLSVEEIAEVLNVSPETAMHDWKLAKVWLLREMSGEKRDEA